MRIPRMLVVVLLLFYFNSGSAAQEIEYFRIINKASGKVLDVENGSSDKGAKIVQLARNDKSETQQWQIVRFGNYIQLANRKSSFVMDIPNGSIIAGAPIIIFPSHGNSKNNHNQLWQLNKSQKGDYLIILQVHSNFVLSLDENSTEDNVKVIQAKYVGSDIQLWRLESTKKSTKASSKNDPSKKKP